jgi:cellobiose-specific phosphotransferase system component IIC
MINWSNYAYKFTVGIGTLCLAALLAELWAKSLSVWVAIALAIVPIALFVVARPDDMPVALVRAAQVVASLWYLVLALSLGVLFLVHGKTNAGWPIYFIGLAIGAVPCLVVLWKTIVGHPMGRASEDPRTMDDGDRFDESDESEH